MPEQRLREWAVASEAVVGDGVGLRGEGDQETRGVADARQARRFQRDVEILERIVAAGVEKHEMDARALRQRVEHVVEMDRPLLDVVDGMQLGVDGKEIVVGGDLQAMAAVIEQGNVGRRGALAEIRDGAPHPRLIEIDAERHPEPQGLKRLGDVPCVVGRVGELANRPVAAVADDQRDAAFRQRRADRDQGQQRQRDDAVRCSRSDPCQFSCGAHGRHPEKPNSVSDAVGRAASQGCRREAASAVAPPRARPPFPATGSPRSACRRRSRRCASGAAAFRGLPRAPATYPCG